MVRVLHRPSGKLCIAFYSCYGQYQLRLLTLNLCFWILWSRPSLLRCETDKALLIITYVSQVSLVIWTTLAVKCWKFHGNYEISSHFMLSNAIPNTCQGSFIGGYFVCTLNQDSKLEIFILLFNSILVKLEFCNFIRVNLW